jgi:hypothetical protein
LTTLHVLIFCSESQASNFIRFMSCLIKDSRGRIPYWIASFTDSEGRRLKRSTKTTDKELATRLAQEWEAAGKAGRAGRLATSASTDSHRSSITGFDGQMRWNKRPREKQRGRGLFV